MDDFREAILDNFLSDRPEGWDYDKIIEKLSSEQNYNPNTDPECPEDESLDIWEYYEDWNTEFLAKHINDIVISVSDAITERCLQAIAKPKVE